MKSSKLKRGPNFLPMLDVIFILLFFFMFSLVILSEKGQLDVKLPKISKRTTSKKGKAPIVTFKRSGKILFESVLYKDLDSFARAIESKKIREVSLAADGESPYRNVIQIIGVIKEAGVEKVSLLFERKRKSTYSQ